MENRVLNRIPYFDEKSRGFRAVEGLENKPLRSYTWSCDVWNDQGQEGACVGFAWSHELSAKPKIVRVDAQFALSIYHVARAKYDPWPGEDYDGTTVLAGVKAVGEHLNSLGNAYVKEYRWAFGLEDLARVLAYKGPAVLGINWYSGMWSPDSKGFLHKTGEKVGGHAILANGIKIVKKDSTKPATWDNVDLDKSSVRLHNSWGQDWGVNGEAFLSLRDMGKLLDEDGEACIPTLRSWDR